MGLLQKYEDFLNSGDPLVRDWFLVGNNYLPFFLSLGYAIVSLTGPYFMRNRQPWELRNLMVIFNFSVVAVYAYILTTACLYLPRVPWKLFCYGGHVKEGEIAYKLVVAAYYAYILKYAEFLDTIIFILRKKNNQITFLHVFHHFLVPIIGWLIFRTEINGLQAIPGLLNTIVHVVMYTYYGLAAMGPSVRKYLWWKKYLTQMQIVQFILMILFVFLVPSITGCPMRTMTYIINILVAPLFFILFYRFYRMTFDSSSKKVKKN